MKIMTKMTSILFVFLIVFSSFSLISATSEINDNVSVIIHFDQFRYLEQQCENDALFRLECNIGEERFESPMWDVSFF